MAQQVHAPFSVHCVVTAPYPDCFIIHLVFLFSSLSKIFELSQRQEQCSFYCLYFTIVNFGSVCLQKNGSKEFKKLEQKGTFLIHTAI